MGVNYSRNQRAIKNPQVKIRKRKGRQVNQHKVIKNPIPGTYQRKTRGIEEQLKIPLSKQFRRKHVNGRLLIAKRYKGNSEIL